MEGNRGVSQPVTHKDTLMESPFSLENLNVPHEVQYSICEETIFP